MRKEYMQEAEEIVNDAFGHDYYDAVDYLVKLQAHADGCGCRVCHTIYDAELDRVASQFRAPYDELYIETDQPEAEMGGYRDDDGLFHYYPAVW